jgi:SAM-dependent methyltransferase
MNRPEFDRYSASYEELLNDPIRDRFAGAGSDYFHTRKRDLIRDYFRSRNTDTRQLCYLDIGCGKGELISLLGGDFARVAGCDPSPGMLDFAENVDTRVQDHPEKIPFDTSTFDFVSAVCVYHHVPPGARLALTHEIHRVLRPGGVFALIEHNPYNPITRLIVSRTLVDTGAILLKPAESRRCMSEAGFANGGLEYFLFFPAALYKRGAHAMEEWLRSVPLGGQYVAFGHKRSTVS